MTNFTTDSSSYTRTLLTQFNLFKYDNGSSKDSINKNSVVSSYYNVGLLIFIVTIFIVISSSLVLTFNNSEPKSLRSENYTNKDDVDIPKQLIDNLSEILISARTTLATEIVSDNELGQFESIDNIWNSNDDDMSQILYESGEQQRNEEITDVSTKSTTDIQNELQTTSHKHQTKDYTSSDEDNNLLFDNDLLADSSEHFYSRRNNKTSSNYLLERENIQPVAEKYKRHLKVKFFEPKNEHQKNDVGVNNDEEEEITNSNINIRDQIPRPPKMRIRRLHNDYIDSMEEANQPRPFKFFLYGQPPSEFQKNSKNKINNIQDVLNQIEDDDSSIPRKIKISGKYRHAKGKGISRLFQNTKRSRKHRNSNTSQQQHANRLTNQMYEDPFHPFKPDSPNDINQLAIRQMQFAPLQYSNLDNIGQSASTQYHPEDLQEIYQRVIAAGRERIKLFNKNHEKQKKPLSLMLDIYPMSEDEQQNASQRPYKKRRPAKYPSGLRPFQSAEYDATYSQQHLDNSYFNTMKFPQVQPLSNSFHQNAHILQHTDSNLDNMSPSQIMVYLNLFPKKKAKYRPSSYYKDYDHNYRRRNLNSRRNKTSLAGSNHKNTNSKEILETFEIELEPRHSSEEINLENHNVKTRRTSVLNGTELIYLTTDIYSNIDNSPDGRHDRSKNIKNSEFKVSDDSILRIRIGDAVTTKDFTK